MNPDEQKICIPAWQFEQARKVQVSLLPKQIPQWNCLSFAYEYHSLDPIGGDYLDFFDIKGNKKGLLIADVSGHGVPAAIITAMAKMSFSNHAVLSDSPKEILKRVNEDIYKFLGDSGLYITAFFMVIDQDLKVCYCSAGHPPVIYYRNETNTFENMKTRGIFIGAFEDAWETYEEKEVQLMPGDRVVFYTDGVVEARNPQGEQYGVKRVEDTVSFSSALPPEKLAKIMVNDVKTYCADHPLTDDMSILVLEVSLKLQAFQQAYQEGRTLLEQKDPRWFLRMKEAFELNQDRFELAFLLGRYYFSKANYSEAKNCFERLINNRIVNPEIYYYMTRIWVEEKKYVKAVALLKEILRDFPDFKEAQGTLGYCFYKMGQIEKSLETYRQLYEKYPENSSYAKKIRFLTRKQQSRNLESFL